MARRLCRLALALGLVCLMTSWHRAHGAPVAVEPGVYCTLLRALPGNPADETPVRVRVESLKALVTAEPGAWVLPESGPLRGALILVKLSDLSRCTR